METCTGTTTRGKPCKNPPTSGADRCRYHVRGVVAAEPSAPSQLCTGTNSKGKPCKQSAIAGTVRCRYHPEKPTKPTKPTKDKKKASKERKVTGAKRPHTITITFGDVAENHAGMEKLGTLSTEGFSIDDLLEAQKRFEAAGIKTDLIELHPYLLEHEKDLVASIVAAKKINQDSLKAAVLIARNGITALLNSKDAANLMMEEQKPLNLDKKAWMRGRVVNKKARYNLCFSETSQEPDYENKKGRIVSFNELPHLKQMRAALPLFYGTKAENLPAEGNYYYDVESCGIGFHGDGERRKVIALRLGATMPMAYQWYHQSKPIGKQFKTDLNHGDLYVMSEKAAGFDWKARSIPTLRHAAGCNEYTKNKEQLLAKWTKQQVKKKTSKKTKVTK